MCIVGNFKQNRKKKPKTKQFCFLKKLHKISWLMIECWKIVVQIYMNLLCFKNEKN